MGFILVLRSLWQVHTGSFQEGLTVSEFSLKVDFAPCGSWKLNYVQIRKVYALFVHYQESLDLHHVNSVSIGIGGCPLAP